MGKRSCYSDEWGRKYDKWEKSDDLSTLFSPPSPYKKKKNPLKGKSFKESMEYLEKQ